MSSYRFAKKFLVFILLTLTCSTAAAGTGETISTHYLSYASEKVKLDIYHPGKDQCPIAILIHGAAGIEGERAQRYRDFASDLMKQGIIAINVHYFDSDEYNWIETIVQTINYAQTLPNADPSKIALIGYSLGGTIALVAASDDDRVSLLVINSGYLPAGFDKEKARKLPPTYILAGTEDKAIETLKALQSWLAEFGIPMRTLINQGYGHAVPVEMFNQNWKSIVAFVSQSFALTPMPETDQAND